jgi:hypothetical protein
MSSSSNQKPREGYHFCEKKTKIIGGQKDRENKLTTNKQKIGNNERKIGK